MHNRGSVQKNHRRLETPFNHASYEILRDYIIDCIINYVTNINKIGIFTRILHVLSQYVTII